MTFEVMMSQVMNEILTGIRVIKFYAWEEHFSGRIHDVRRGELSSLKGRKYLDALCVYFWATTPVLISILTFMTYALLGNKLTAAKVCHFLNQLHNGCKVIQTGCGIETNLFVFFNLVGVCFSPSRARMPNHNIIMSCMSLVH